MKIAVDGMGGDNAPQEIVKGCIEASKVIDDEVKSIIDRCHEQATKILMDHRDVLDRLAALLIEKERITREEFEALFEQNDEKIASEEA